MLNLIGLANLLALVFFIVAWIGYAIVAQAGAGHVPSIMVRMHEYREAWMRRMLERDNRILDMQLVQLLVANISFFASAAILIVGAGLTVLDEHERAMHVLQRFPLVQVTSELLWNVKVMLILLIFVYAFFKFTWALRQFNYVGIMIAAAPMPQYAAEAWALLHAKRTAKVATRAADHFNKAMRAFYFGLAVLAWFLHPWLFVVTTALVLVVNWRREFRSYSLALMGPVGESLEAPTVQRVT